MAQLVKTIQGVAIADVKAVHNLGIASAKTILDVDNTSVGGTPALIASVEENGTANTVTTGAIDTTGANFIVVSVAFYSGVSANGTLSDSKSNTWTALTGQTAGATGRNRLYYFRGGTVGGSHTFTYAAADIYPSIQVLAFSNIAASPIDGENGAATTNATTLATGSVTPSQDDTVIIAGLLHNNTDAGDISINTGFTLGPVSPHVVATSYGGATAYKILTAVAATNPTWDVVDSSSELIATIAVFKY